MCGQSPLAKLDLIFNPGYRHSVMTDISWCNMPLIMFMGADILFFFLFRCQSSASVGRILRQIFSSSFSRFIAHVIVVPVGRTVDVYHYSPYDSSNCGYWQSSLFLGIRIFIRFIFLLFEH